MKKETKENATRNHKESTELRINTDNKIYEAESRFVTYVRSGVYGKKR